MIPIKKFKMIFAGKIEQWQKTWYVYAIHFSYVSGVLPREIIYYPSNSYNKWLQPLTLTRLNDSFLHLKSRQLSCKFSLENLKKLSYTLEIALDVLTRNVPQWINALKSVY